MVFESSHLTKDGQEYPVEIMANFIEFADEEFLFAFARNISDRKQSETALRQSEEQFKRIFKTIQDGYFSLSIYGLIQTVNPACIAALGYGDACQLIQFRFQDVVLANPKQFNQLLDELHKKQELNSYSLSFKRNDGTRLLARITSYNVCYTKLLRVLHFPLH